MYFTVSVLAQWRLVRTIIDMVAKVKVLDTDKALQLQADLCLDSIEWCNQEKHTFLRQRVEARLASMCVDCAVWSVCACCMLLPC